MRVPEDVVFGVKRQDFEFYAVRVVIVQGDLLQVTGTDGAHGEPATTKSTHVLVPVGAILSVGQERPVDHGEHLLSTYSVRAERQGVIRHGKSRVPSESAASQRKREGTEAAPEEEEPGQSTRSLLDTQKGFRRVEWYWG